MPVTVRINPSVTSAQAFIIDDATPFNDGVMTKAQVAKLNALTPGSGGLTLQIAIVSGVAVLGKLVATNSTLAPITITLPPAAGGSGGLIIYAQFGANPVTIVPNGGDTIGEVAGSIVINPSGNKLSLFSDGISDWMIISP